MNFYFLYEITQKNQIDNIFIRKKINNNNFTNLINFISSNLGFNNKFGLKKFINLRKYNS